MKNPVPQCIAIPTQNFSVTLNKERYSIVVENCNDTGKKTSKTVKPPLVIMKGKYWYNFSKATFFNRPG